MQIIHVTSNLHKSCNRHRSAGTMPNTDKVKAARTGGGERYKQKMNGMHAAARLTHDNAKRVQGIQHQLRQFEDAGNGVHTGRQHEHEERMREQKLKREAKAAKAAAFYAQLDELAAGVEGADLSEGVQAATTGAAEQCSASERELALAPTGVEENEPSPSRPSGNASQLIAARASEVESSSASSPTHNSQYSY